jgi:hypothetical protein
MFQPSCMLATGDIGALVLIEVFQLGLSIGGFCLLLVGFFIRRSWWVLSLAAFSIVGGIAWAFLCWETSGFSPDFYTALLPSYCGLASAFWQVCRWRPRQRDD